MKTTHAAQQQENLTVSTAPEGNSHDTFVEAEDLGGGALAALLDSIYGWNPDATLEDVQQELDMFAGVIAEFQDEYGPDAPLAAIR